MELTPYVDTVRQGITNAAALADEQTRAIADRLGSAVDSSTRLALIQALSDATSSISADLAPISIELRMNGTDPQIVVSVPPGDSEPTLLQPAAIPTDEEPADDADEALARISFRLPASVKARVDELAARDGISTNTWLIHAVTEALAERRPWSPPPPPMPPPAPNFVNNLFGPSGPFGPHGVFGPDGPFGDRRSEPGHHSGRHTAQPPRGGQGGAVQGWVK
jgi:hypothetical protein